METISLKLSNQQIQKLLDVYADSKVSSNNEYVIACLNLENCKVTIYTSLKVVFQGKDAEIYAAPFMDFKEDNEFIEHAGSDEVGTGDYFGPIVVCATIIDANTYKLIKDLHIDDSKKITDEEIIKLGPKLMEKVKYSLLILDNAKYNSLKDNMNCIKTKMHNQAYLNLSKKYPLPKLKVIDQFASPQNYYKYLEYEPNVINTIHFETKAESKYLAVGAASIIARYAFIVKFDEICQKYQIDLHKGAGTIVDQDGLKFLRKYGESELVNVAKLNFKNTAKIKMLK